VQHPHRNVRVGQDAGGAVAVNEAYSDDGALHREWPLLRAYVEAHPDVDLDDARAFVAAVGAVGE
jgi:hypothetical protein